MILRQWLIWSWSNLLLELGAAINNYFLRIDVIYIKCILGGYWVLMEQQLWALMSRNGRGGESQFRYPFFKCYLENDYKDSDGGKAVDKVGEEYTLKGHWKASFLLGWIHGDISYAYCIIMCTCASWVQNTTKQERLQFLTTFRSVTDCLRYWVGEFRSAAFLIQREASKQF